MGRVLSPRSSWVQQVAQAVPREVERQDEEEDCQARKETQPWRGANIAAGCRKVGARRGNWGLGAKTEERQCSLVENGEGETEGHEHDDRPERIGEDLPKD